MVCEIYTSLRILFFFLFIILRQCNNRTFKSSFGVIPRAAVIQSEDYWASVTKLQ